MALQLPRGLFDVGIFVLDEDEEPGAIVHNFYPRSISATYANDTAQIEGADVLLEQLEFNERYDLTLETAGIPMAALAAMEGVTLATSGTGSTLVTTLNKNVTADQRPYLRLTAQQKDKTGGATEYTFWRATLASSPSLNFAQGEYATPTMSLVATPATLAVTGPPAIEVGDLYQIEQLATYAALS